MTEETNHNRHMRYLLVIMAILLTLANVFHFIGWRDRVEIHRMLENRGEIHLMILESKKANRPLTVEEIARAIELLK